MCDRLQNEQWNINQVLIKIIQWQISDDALLLFFVHVWIPTIFDFTHFMYGEAIDIQVQISEPLMVTFLYAFWQQLRETMYLVKYRSLSTSRALRWG